MLLAMDSGFDVNALVRAMFANNEQGVLYDPSDFSTLYQDAAGTTPVTALGQSVGLMLDKRLGLVLGPELSTNDFSSNLNGWYVGVNITSAVASGGEAVVTFSGAMTSTAGNWFGLSGSYTAGDFYEVVFDARYVSGPSGNLQCGAGFVANFSVSSATNAGIKTRYRAVVYGTIPSAAAIIEFGGPANSVWAIDNVSVKKLPGNHAYQSTALSRPTVEARVNLATATEGAAATWSVSNVSDAGTPITGFSNSLQFGDNSIVRQAYKTPALTLSTTYTVSIFVEMDDGNAPSVGVNTTTGDFCIVSDGNFHTASASIHRISTNIYRVSSARTVTVGGAARNCGVIKYTTQSARTFRVIGIQVEEGTTRTTYQRVNTATDYVDVGAPRYLQFDGTDDGMATPSIDFTGTDKMTVWAGVRKLSDAAQGMICELSANGSTNAGAFYLLASSSSLDRYQWNSRGTSSSAISPGGYAAPITNILTGIGDIAGDISTLRANGTQAATSAADQGTGKFGNYPLYIGRRGGTTLPFNGRLYGLIVRGAASNAGQIAVGETWMNVRTRAY